MRQSGYNGTIHTNFSQGNYYLLIMIDHASRYDIIETLPSHICASPILTKTVAMIDRQHCHRLKRAHSNNAKEITSYEVCTFPSSLSISRPTSISYQPQDNRIVEHLNRSIMEPANSNLAHYSFHDKIWDLEVVDEIFKRNIIRHIITYIAINDL